MVPFEAFSMSAAHSLVAGTSGWAGGSQIEILRSTVLPWAGAEQATLAGPSKPSARTSASFFIVVSSDLFVRPTYRALTRAPTAFIAPAERCPSPPPVHRARPPGRLPR